MTDQPTSKPAASYVAGFMFDNLRQQVVLIRKEKPAWQKGKFNGVGGKIEPGEEPVRAMVREFFEETGGAEREQVELLTVLSIFPGHPLLIGNLPWLIPLALDMLGDGRPGFVDARYPDTNV